MMKKQDHQSALNHFEKSAAYDNKYGLVFSAIFNLISKRDLKKSLVYLIKATKRNNRVAQYLLGMMYASPKYGSISFNSKILIQWLTLAANNGWTDALLFLAYSYRGGTFSEFNLGKSISYFEKIANQDDSTKKRMKDRTLYLFGNKNFEMVMTDVTEDFEGTIETPDIREWGNVELSMLYEDLIKDPYVYMVFWDLFKKKESRFVMDSQSMLGATYMTGECQA